METFLQAEQISEENPSTKWIGPDWGQNNDSMTFAEINNLAKENNLRYYRGHWKSLMEAIMRCAFSLAMILLLSKPFSVSANSVVRPIQVGVTEKVCTNMHTQPGIPPLNPLMVAYDGDNKSLLIASNSGDIFEDTIVSGICTRITTVANLEALVYIGHRDVAVSLDDGHRLAMINLNSGSLRNLGGPLNGFSITGLAYDRVHARLYISGNDSGIRVMSIPGTSVVSLPVRIGDIGGSLSIDPTNKVLYCFDYSGNSVVSIINGRVTTVRHSPFSDERPFRPLFYRARDIAFDSYGEQLLLAAGDAVLRLGLDGEVLGMLSTPDWLVATNSSEPWSITTSDDGSIVYVADGEKIVRFDLSPPKLRV